ncbi:hypothetical protein BY996DRAFT_8403350 [Phakopsora pachyrhizi]|nr:hypothetical protein BY996DRAFT_8403350 [Phakopsora pachyrhizi]
MSKQTDNDKRRSNDSQPDVPGKEAKDVEEDHHEEYRKGPSEDHCGSSQMDFQPVQIPVGSPRTSGTLSEGSKVDSDRWSMTIQTDSMRSYPVHQTSDPSMNLS